MATFSNLYYATDVLVEVLKGVTPSVIAAPPPESPDGPEGIYLSLAYVVEQPGHKNDGYERSPDGTSRPPPLTTSMYYLVTTYGATAQKNAEGAHRILGQVLQLLHDRPVIDLSALGVPASRGKGQLDVTVVPMTPDLMEKLFQSQRPRPFALIEVGPVQIESARPDLPPGAVVRPGGVGLVGPRPTASPAISRVTPLRVAQDGWIRIDGPFPAEVTAVAVGTTILSGPAVVPAGDAAESVRVRLPAATFEPGVQRVRVSLGEGLASDEVAVLVLPAGTWSLDAPAAASHSLASGPLTLTGQNLSAVDAVLFWPDCGISDPSDVRVAPASSATATSVVVTPPIPPGAWRLAARVALGAGVPAQFTPYLVLEVVR